MNRPEMVIFDYGHTLLYQPNFNEINANKAIYKKINRNPQNITFEEYNGLIKQLLTTIFDNKNTLIEYREYDFLKTALEYMNISLSVSIEEAEKIIFNALSEGAVMPYADVMLDYLNSVGIRTGVISNLCFSSDTLKSHIDRLLPRNQFEFVMTSSDYMFKKPHRLMFVIALQKSNLTADKVWYCGDSIASDVCGAQNAGIFPVLYEGNTMEEIDKFAHQNDGLKVDFEYLHIRDWREMIEILKKVM